MYIYCEKNKVVNHRCLKPILPKNYLTPFLMYSFFPQYVNEGLVVTAPLKPDNGREQKTYLRAMARYLNVTNSLFQEREQYSFPYCFGFNTIYTYKLISTTSLV